MAVGATAAAAVAAPGGGGGAGAFRFVLGGLFGILAAAEEAPLLLEAAPAPPDSAPKLAAPCDCDRGMVLETLIWFTGVTEEDTARVVVLETDGVPELPDAEESPYVALS